VQLGLVEPSDIQDGTVVRMPKAYPMYDSGWNEQLKRIRGYIESDLSNLQLVGRNGLHKYNNQDHSMLTAMTAVDNIIEGRVDKTNLWDLNTEMEYHESKDGK